MLHSRTDTEQDDLALRCLPACEYKAYRYLVNRADPIGICYPKQATIADAIGYGEREVQRALEVLHDNAVFRYRRRNAVDPDTRRRLHNVYQVNPLLLIIAEQFVADAWSEWDALILKCGNVSIRLWSRINQHQEPTPLTNTKEHAPGTSTKQPSKAKGKNGDSAADGNQPPVGNGKAKNKKTDGEANQREQTTQRGHAPKSSVPPERPQYANPDAINSNLPDEAHEGLASNLRQFGIAMPLARGFVVTYGYNRTKLAFDQVKKMGDKAREPAAVFRSIVQVRLADDFALAQQQIFGRKQSR
jgi:hypothetical protein